MHSLSIMFDWQDSHWLTSGVSDLVGVQNLKEGFVNVRLALESVLYLVDIVDGMVELHRLVVLHGRTSGGPTEWLVELNGWGAGRSVRRYGRIALAALCQGLGLERLEHGRKD